MMKILIVDDEVLTREGLISSINWNALGIDEIIQADDGIHALAAAREHLPDIVLCDVRMPRMNGIQLVKQLESFLPDTAVIFMSGYSDKEYLKAAIHLKAVSYVEKPLNPKEIENTVRKAGELYQRNLRSRKTEVLYSAETSSQLAFLLTRPYSDMKEKIHNLADELSLRFTPESCCTTFIVKLDRADYESTVLSHIWDDLNKMLRLSKLCAFYICTHAVCHVYHILGDKAPSLRMFSDIENILKQLFLPVGNFYISRGETVSGISKAYQSYTAAVILLQSSFFFAPGTVLNFPANEPAAAPAKTIFDSDADAYFSEVLAAKNEDACLTFLEDLYHHYNKNQKYLPNQIKDLYYKLFIVLNENRHKAKLSPDMLGGTTEETIIEYLESCFSYAELHGALTSKTTHYFHALSQYVPEDSTIYLIKDYISKNYSLDTFSIKDISDHVHLTTSYVCTYFKNQTGQTPNQYLTEYRMEKAKQLLCDPRNQITDISAKVGYSNGNYFSKTFKKYTGLTPSQYREKILG